MIDPAKLTEEQGFVHGCVVQYRTHLGGGVRWFCLEGQFALDFNGMTRIRPLTGPMAIWNFAPEWATHCMESRLDIKWYDHEPTKSHSWQVVSSRPFWAGSEK